MTTFDAIKLSQETKQIVVLQKPLVDVIHEVGVVAQIPYASYQGQHFQNGITTDGNYLVNFKTQDKPFTLFIPTL